MSIIKSLIRPIAITALTAGVAVALSACGNAPVVGGNPQPRSVNVTGSSVVYAKPDIGQVSVGIEVVDSTVQAAMSQNEQVMQKILAALKEQGVAEEDIQTSNFSVWVDQTYDENGNPQKIAGYRVSNDLTIIVRDVNKIGIVLEAATNAGANKIYGISFAFSDTSALREQAREKAVADAKAKAEALAKLSGATVGQVLSISEYSSSASPVPVALEARDMAAGSAPSISAGQMGVTVEVNVSYELK
ncbi:MAG TPA: SIMPL domain-containing protein [Anaerolineales bacterium]|nr:SIMPL domain-containing protein [Anaerolineales bacterium]